MSFGQDRVHRVCRTGTERARVCRQNHATIARIFRLAPLVGSFHHFTWMTARKMPGKLSGSRCWLEWFKYHKSNQIPWYIMYSSCSCTSCRFSSYDPFSKRNHVTGWMQFILRYGHPDPCLPERVPGCLIITSAMAKLEAQTILEYVCSYIDGHFGRNRLNPFSRVSLYAFMKPIDSSLASIKWSYLYTKIASCSYINKILICLHSTECLRIR